MSFLFLEVHRGGDVVIASTMFQYHGQHIKSFFLTYVQLNEPVYRRKNVLVTCYIIQCVWSVLFNPGQKARLVSNIKAQRQLTPGRFIPWQAVFQLYWQIRSTSLPFCFRSHCTEDHGLVDCLSTLSHLVVAHFYVGHVGNVCAERL